METENVRNQSYKVGYNLTKLLVEKYLLYVLNFVFENNLIEKQVEKVRVLKNKNTKKKKGGGSNYKSIVKERYIYKEEEAKRIAEYVFDELEKINKERKESEYTKEEWEVKSHIRTLKDGRKRAS